MCLGGSKKNHHCVMERKTPFSIQKLPWLQMYSVKMMLSLKETVGNAIFAIVIVAMPQLLSNLKLLPPLDYILVHDQVLDLILY